MNDFALASSRTLDLNGIIIRQAEMGEFDQFVEYAHPIREALRADKSDPIQVFLKHSAETVGLIHLLTDIDDISKLTDDSVLMLNIIMGLHKLNTAFFDEDKKPERRKNNDKSTWFDGFQFLIGIGHKHSEIMRYTYGTYLGYMKAAGKAHRQNIRMAAVATRNAQHATKIGFDKFERELSKD